MNQIESAEARVLAARKDAASTASSIEAQMLASRRRFIVFATSTPTALLGALGLIVALQDGFSSIPTTFFWAVPLAMVVAACLFGLLSTAMSIPLELLRSRAQAIVLFRSEVEAVLGAKLDTVTASTLRVRFVGTTGSDDTGKALLAIARISGLSGLVAALGLNEVRHISVNVLRSEADRAMSAKVDVAELFTRALENGYDSAMLHSVTAELLRK